MLSSLIAPLKIQNTSTATKVNMFFISLGLKLLSLQINRKHQSLISSRRQLFPATFEMDATFNSVIEINDVPVMVVKSTAVEANELLDSEVSARSMIDINDVPVMVVEPTTPVEADQLLAVELLCAVR